MASGSLERKPAAIPARQPGEANEKGTPSALSARDQTGLMKPISPSIPAFGPIGTPILWWFAE